MFPGYLAGVLYLRLKRGKLDIKEIETHMKEVDRSGYKYLGVLHMIGV